MSNRGVQRVTAAGRESLELSFVWWQQHRQYMAELHGVTGLSPMEVHAVRGLARDVPMATLALAELIHCEPSNITTVVDRLARAGLVERRADPDDRRIRHVFLTDAGVDAQTRVNHYLATPPAAINRLTGPEQQALRDLLRKMVGG